ncbi:MAG: family 2B encapsulin nanocompartment shell protein [Syntrophobacteraceae bacterium]
MSEESIKQQQSLSTSEARKLATTTKTVPQMEAITPRWLLHMLPWVQVQSGTYRVNKVKVSFREESKFDESARALLSTRFDSNNYEVGAMIIKEGEDLGKLFLVACGNAEVTKVGAHGKRLRVTLLREGDYFRGSSLIDEDASTTVTVIALTPCTIVSLDLERLAGVLEEAPQVGKLVKYMHEEHTARDELSRRNIAISSSHKGEAALPDTYIDYESEPKEYPLSIVQTVVRVHTRVSDLYNDPIDQLREQLRLTIEGMKEKQEWEMLNNPEFGLLNAVEPRMRISTRRGMPTPDDLDELISKVWKKPAFFLANPRSIAAVGRECTRRGVPPPTITMYGVPFFTWRGIPFIPSDKIPVDDGMSSILLLRVGEKEQGVVGLHQAGIPGEQMPSLSVRLMGIDSKAIASHLLTLYFSVAILAEDALAMLENVDIGYWHDYP